MKIGEIMAGNTIADLQAARKNKNDEFYTQLTDIEEELKHYNHLSPNNQFKDKVVYCNCDDPEESNFFKYFAANFSLLGLKKLICTHYEYDEKKKSYLLTITRGRDINKDGKIGRADVEKKEFLFSNGDFRSDECIALLKQSDIVCTNPPFSLFREYVAQLIEYKKKFLIIGNQNAITYKSIFILIREDKLWLGESIHSGDREFLVPNDYPLTAVGSRIDEKGKKYIRIKGVRWFTNLDYKKRHEDFTPKKYQTYVGNEKNYPKYHNYDAINIDRSENIPIDYDGVMGVPITFLDKWNPDQFEIVELGIVGSCTFTNNRKMEILDGKTGLPTGKFTMNAKGTLYKKFDPSKPISPNNKKAFRDVETGEFYSSIYARVLIKRKPTGEKK